MAIKFVTDFNKEAVFYKNKEYTYKDLIREAKYISKVLGIEKGEKVVNFMENRPEFICSFFGIWNSKGVPINIDAGYTAEELEYILTDADPKVIMTSNKNLKVAEEAIKLSGKNIRIINCDEIKSPEDFEVDEYVIYSPEPEDIGVLLYTSGTTGKPKGVVLTFDNLMSNVDAIIEIKMATPKDRLLALLPYHHVLPLSINLLMAIHIGTLVVLIDELSASAILGALQKYKITIVVGVPRLWEMIHKGLMEKIKSSKIANLLFELCKKVKSVTLSKIVFKKVHQALGGNIRYLVSGGAKLDPNIMDDFKVLGIKVLEGYGLTETSPIIAFTRPDDVCIGTVGKTIPGVEVKIAEDGELLVKGRNVLKEYYNKPEATKEAKDENGWFHTGDLGKIENGYITIIGRKKEMIVLSNGKNINPIDIENEIAKGSDLIKEIAVMEHNNHLLALVYPDFKLIKERSITNITETLKWDIIDSYNINAPAYRKILEIKIVKDEFPKTKLGKLRRFMLKDILKNLEDGGENSHKERPEDPESKTREFQTLAQYIKEEKGENIYPDSHIEIDLGLDSLDIIQLNSFIEKTFGFKIKEEETVDLKVIKDICEYIRKNSKEYHLEKINWSEILKESIDYPLPSSNMIWLTKIFFAPILKFYLGLKIKGIEKLSKEPRIIICNHESFIDAFAVQRLFKGDMLKNTYYFAIKKHFNKVGLRFMANHGNIILMDINENLKESLQISAEVLKEGKNLVIFPEGARTRDGKLQDFKKFFGILSKELNIPVTVLGIDGAYKSMPFGSIFPRPAKIKLEVLGEVNPSGLSVEEIVNNSKEIIRVWKSGK
ncbi:AMP-binding protein [uncultured Fusobacterium sp.]|uniref:AMP-binding protein n=1 Tax=uncultured Fusobacterium sp. TaxID=159267 RepID=UPI0027DCD07E|nr:AMP-binding protein [uncultured Fusobacterium sp.]